MVNLREGGTSEEKPNAMGMIKLVEFDAVCTT